LVSPYYTKQGLFTNRLSDEALRRSFLENVAGNREIVAEFERIQQSE
jgi:hypothetical protein